MTLSLVRWRKLYMIEIKLKIKNMMKGKRKVKQEILIAPQWMKVKERLLKEVVSMLI